MATRVTLRAWSLRSRHGSRHGQPSVIADVRKNNSSMTKPTSKRMRKPKPKPIVHAIQIYDNDKLGFPLAIFEGIGQFQDIAKGDTMDGRCWAKDQDASNYAKIYRVISIRHTLRTMEDGSVHHLKSLFVEAVIPINQKYKTK
jgi:hypothetical protein